jgi:hypothetical protein
MVSITQAIEDLIRSRKARRSNPPTIFTDAMEVDCHGSMDNMSEEDLKNLGLRARIKKLKGVGWRRDRFNGNRYRVLCETALEELENGR